MSNFLNEHIFKKLIVIGMKYGSLKIQSHGKRRKLFFEIYQNIHSFGLTILAL